HPIALAMDASGLLDAVADAAAGRGGDGPIHERLATAWGTPRAELIRRTLVLCADHELNASTFAARVTASTGASLAAAALAGLATLTGPLHGSAAAAVLALSDDALRDGAEAAIMARLGQGFSVPSFGHPLYPDGDIRSQHLLGHIVLPPIFRELAAVGEEVTGERPNIDFALAAMTVAYELP